MIIDTKTLEHKKYMEYLKNLKDIKEDYIVDGEETEVSNLRNKKIINTLQFSLCDDDEKYLIICEDGSIFVLSSKVGVCGDSFISLRKVKRIYTKEEIDSQERIERKRKLKGEISRLRKRKEEAIKLTSTTYLDDVISVYEKELKEIVEK